MFFLPGIDFFCPNEIILVFGYTIKTGGQDGCGTVRTGIFTEPMFYWLPCNSTTALVVPSRFYPFKKVGSRVQILRFLCNLIEAQHCQGNPFRIVVIIIAIASVALVRVYGLNSFIPLVEHLAIFSIVRSEISINNDVHGMSLRPVARCGSVFEYIGIVDKIMRSRIPKASQQSIGCAVGGRVPINGVKPFTVVFIFDILTRE